MLAKRIIPCLDVKNNRVVKGINFTDFSDAGDPVEQGISYSKQGADELIFLDITATNENRETFTDLVVKIAEGINIPFAVGGGVKSIQDIRQLLLSGADKVTIGSAAVENPQLIKDSAKIFGSQCIVISVDAKRVGSSWKIYIKGGSEETGIDAVDFSKQMAELGAGELLVNSLDKDGTYEGYDIDLLQEVNKTVNIPIIASSGAGKLEHFLDAFGFANVDAVLAASLFHFGELSINELKNYLQRNNINMRL